MALTVIVWRAAARRSILLGSPAFTTAVANLSSVRLSPKNSQT